MKLLEDRILSDGVALNSDVLLVDSFLNNQVDTSLMGEVGRAFAEAARDLQIDRVVTIESSGIAPAQMTAIALGVPLVILKKSASRILKDDVLQTEVFSFTKNSAYQLTLRPKYVRKGERVLLVDDFLARGEAACGAARLIEEAGAQVAAIGIVIEKAFQPGRALLDEKGSKVISLARVSKMGEGNIEFTQADA